MKLTDFAKPRPLDKAIRVYQHWLHLPDPSPALAVWAAYLANCFNGDPIWLMLTGASSSGKSELLRAIESMPNVYPVDSLSEASLLTGKIMPDGTFQTGGLLPRMGRFGLILFTDFSNVLSMDRHQKPKIMAAFRKVFDGSWTREIGTDGGQSLSWRGKCALLSGAPPGIEGHRREMGIMGERFLYFRMNDNDENDDDSQHETLLV